MTTALAGYAVGYDGNILKTLDGGEHWDKLAIPGVRSFRGVVFADEKSGVAVGDGGIVYRTDDAGANWTRVDVGLSTDLNSVSVHNGVFYIAGSDGLVIKQ